MTGTTIIRTALLLLLGLALTGCGKREAAVGGKDPTSPAQVLAHVNGTPITARELAHLREKMGVESVAADKRAEVEEKLLQALVNSRAMALLMEQGMSKEERESLAVKVAAYREELLVQRYLRAHVTPEPVSSAMVKEYYENHSEEFGGGVERTFEVLSTTREVSEQERNEILKQLGTAAQVADWKKWAERLQSLSMGYRKATARADVLEAPLKGLVQGTPVGKVSPVHSGKSIMIVKVLDEQKLAPKPLQEVSAAIRKKLAPVKLKEAVRAASTEALSKVQVTYENGRKPANQGSEVKN